MFPTKVGDGAGGCQNYVFEGHALRATMRGDELWFVAADVCAALGYKQTPQTLRMLDADRRMVVPNTFGERNGGGTVTIIHESGFYDLAFRSRKPLARQFSKWLIKNVLTSELNPHSFAAQIGNTNKALAQAHQKARRAVQ